MTTPHQMDKEKIYYDASRNEPLFDYFSPADWDKLRQAKIIYALPDENGSFNGWCPLRIRSVTIKEAKELGLSLLKTMPHMIK